MGKITRKRNKGGEVMGRSTYILGGFGTCCLLLWAQLWCLPSLVLVIPSHQSHAVVFGVAKGKREETVLTHHLIVMPQGSTQLPQIPNCIPEASANLKCGYHRESALSLLEMLDDRLHEVGWSCPEPDPAHSCIYSYGSFGTCQAPSVPGSSLETHIWWVPQWTLWLHVFCQLAAS